ncbi:5022_t:CDS:10 [Paraglomus occultum]|uniref:5022_t:CDS:1 n=1 Tax=Paraglomus occultum TaxID=144539 RepID=A0A9N9D7Y1_9GLOM|nr:5022_t:CDS:10 [Paraglomus occultum]
MPNELTRPIIVPLTTVQADWTEVVSDVVRGVIASGSFWCVNVGRQSVHGSVTIRKNQEDPMTVDFIGNDGLEVTRVTNYSFAITCEQLGINGSIVKGPKATKKIHDSSVTAMDISPGGALFVTGDEKGLIKVGDAKSGTTRRELVGHVAGIGTCRFFPSGQVVLSGSSDFQLRIWSVLDGSNPVTLKAHTKGITDSAIIDRGRNVLSSSRDGTIRLWECGSASVIRTLGNYNVVVNNIALGSVASDIRNWENKEADIDSREVATDDKIICCALENGIISVIDLRSKDEAFSINSYRNTALYACAYDGRYAAVSGSAEGVIELYDIRNPSISTFALQRKDAPIYDIGFINKSSILVAPGDGTAFQFALDTLPTMSSAAHEFVGFDVDPIYSIRTVDSGQSIYAVGRDGCLRSF